jgi:GNAT superfamily N-acetyltransferase
MAAVTIREAMPADAGTIVLLIRALAAYENMADLVRITDADVLRDGFGDRRCFEALLAEVDGQAVGLALHRPSYSTFDGRPGLYVEDLFVAESARGLGIGRMLMARLAAIARERGCSRMTLAVLHWNPARDFYRASASSRSRTGCPTSSRATPWFGSRPSTAQPSPEAWDA